MDDTNVRTAQGGCYRSAVRYEVWGPLRGVVNCYCNQCSKLNGSYGAHSKALKSNIKIIKDDGLRWFNISETTRRGFCEQCGSGLFWDSVEQDSIGIVAGSLDQPTGLETIGHIFVKDKNDFYEINDELQKFDASSNGQLKGDYL